MPKRKTKKKAQQSHNIIKYSSIVAIVVLVLSITAIAGYYFGFSEGKKQSESRFKAQKEKLLKEIKHIRDSIPKKSRQERLNALLKKHDVVLASHEYEKSPPKGPKRKAVKKVHKPKLAIIIDDVSFKADIAKIKALHMPITMSFLPPNKRHPDSAKLAAKEPYYMVHLPLEAFNFNAEEMQTLHTKDSQQSIVKRIKEIKKLFPKVKYINNHTGSKFTANELAMNRLMFALRKNKIMFIDSRTTAQTKVPKVMRNYGLPYIARDVFLDHVADITEIKRQLKRAIAIAKRSGSAIAIGHPRLDTLQALKESKELLKSVELVRIDDYL
jgi:polysaccharide deacetylase 2 family uncharacterized protein YibQ